MILNSLMFLFDADVSKLVEGEKKANNETDKLQKNIVATDKEAKNLGASFNETIASIAGALTSLISVGAITSAIFEAKDYVIELDNVASGLGIAKDELNAFNRVVEVQGGNLQSLSGSLGGLNEKIAEASKGEGEFAEFFNKFGISLKDAEGNIKSTTDILPSLADTFERMGKVESFAIGKKMGLDEATIRTLQLGRAELEANLIKQKQLFQITDKQVEAFQKFDKTLKEGKASFRDLFVVVGSEVIPVFTYFMEKVNKGIDFIKEHPDLVKGVFIALATAITAYALPAIIRFGISSAVAFAPFYLIGGIIAGVALAVGMLYEDISIFLEGGNSAFEDLLRWIGATEEEIEAFRQAFISAGQGIAEAFSVIGEIIQVVFGLLFQVAKAVYSAFEPVIKVFAEGLVGAIKSVLGWLSKLGDTMQSVKAWFGFGDDVKVEANKQIDTSNKDFLTVANDMGSNPINGMSSNAISNSNKNVSSEVKIEKIEIQTQATDSGAISKDIGNNLSQELNRVNANYEDGILA